MLYRKNSKMIVNLRTTNVHPYMGYDICIKNLST